MNSWWRFMCNPKWSSRYF